MDCRRSELTDCMASFRTWSKVTAASQPGWGQTRGKFSAFCSELSTKRDAHCLQYVWSQQAKVQAPDALIPSSKQMPQVLMGRFESDRRGDPVVLQAAPCRYFKTVNFAST